MKAMYIKRVCCLLAFTGVLSAGMLLTSGCTYDELTPKTDNITSDYVTPKGVLPTADESAAVRAIREEYNQSIK